MMTLMAAGEEEDKNARIRTQPNLESGVGPTDEESLLFIEMVSNLDCVRVWFLSPLLKLLLFMMQLSLPLMANSGRQRGRRRANNIKATAKPIEFLLVGLREEFVELRKIWMVVLVKRRNPPTDFNNLLRATSVFRVFIAVTGRPVREV